MAQFKALDPNAEVRGDVVLSTINVMGAFKRIANGILEDHGIRDLAPNRWYPQQAWLSSFETISKEVGPNTLYQIGRQITEQAHYPPGLDSIEAVFSALDDAYQECHRGGDVGAYRFMITGMRSGMLIAENAYPCDFDRGVVESLAHRFEPEGSFAEVRHDSLSPCKKLGGDSCTYTVRW
jgi:hypothetical protein